jgi:hypothetical protein
VNDERIDDPDEEFRAAVTDVRPLPSRDRAAPDAPKPPPVAEGVIAITPTGKLPAR